MPIHVKIKENSCIAKIASWKLNANRCAIVIDKTIHLHCCSKQDFLNNTQWFCHEIAHILQWQKEGKVKFVLEYLFYSIKFGYFQNPFEIEARKMENNIELKDKIIIVS